MSIPGARVEPFRGLRYAPRLAGSMASIVAPPYDLIGPERQEQLYARSPYNIVRLELNRDADRYQSSAQMLDRWIEEGVLIRDNYPAIYFYTQKFRHEGRARARSGFVVRFRVENFARGRILPHERTFPAAREDRLRLLTATKANFSSIFGLYSGRYPELQALSEKIANRPPVAEVVDDLGIANELRVIEAFDEIAIVQRALEAPRVLIADGHHRYETALEYQRRRRADDGDPPAARPYDYTMMTLVACDDPGLVVLPTHRVVRGLSSAAMESFASRAGGRFALERLEGRAQLMARVADAGRGTIGVALAGMNSTFLMRLKHHSAIPAPGVPDEVQQLDVWILHALVLEPIFGLDPAAIRAGGKIEYTIDAASALDSVSSGLADGAFLMNPPSIGDLERVSNAGATMPEKSTYFYPKLLTGLVMNPLRE